MSQVDEVVAALNDATNAVAEDLERLRAEVQNTDAATVEKLQPIADRRSCARSGSRPGKPGTRTDTVTVARALIVPVDSH